MATETPSPFTGLLGIWGQVANFGVIAVMTVILAVKILYLDPNREDRYREAFTAALDRQGDKHAESLDRLVHELKNERK